jgi:membrane protein DedA with SNARE-associated domain
VKEVVTASATSSPTGLTGLSGFAADVIDRLGAVGVGVLTLLETVVPPIPSEVVLPLAGYLAERGLMSLAWVLVAATIGSVLGAMLLYEAARRIGEQRTTRLLARVPLVDEEDGRRAADWFRRHGRPAVFFGRLVPGVRSLISLPAGASRMPRVEFLLLTTVGSLVWNSLLVGAGYALGTQYDRVAEYADLIDWVVVAVVVALVALVVVRRLRSRRRATR